MPAEDMELRGRRVPKGPHPRLPAVSWNESRCAWQQQGDANAGDNRAFAFIIGDRVAFSGAHNRHANYHTAAPCPTLGRREWDSIVRRRSDELQFLHLQEAIYIRTTSRLCRRYNVSIGAESFTVLLTNFVLKGAFWCSLPPLDRTSQNVKNPPKSATTASCGGFLRVGPEGLEPPTNRL
jgi:hypothetical protein